MANYLTDEEKDYILKNRLKLTIGQISQNLNRKHQTIQSFLRRNKLSYLNKISLKNNQELTKRQLEVLKLISKGYSNEEISEKMVISVDTVKTHINGIYSKFNINRQTKDVSTMRVRAVLKYLNLEDKND